jgi:membrane protein implicated in regulation of membrane protease activity
MGDLLGDLFSIGIQFPLFQPISLFVGLTVFGGSGFILNNWTTFSLNEVVLYAAVISLIAVIFFYFVVIQPANRTESSTGFQLRDLVGKQGEVWVAIPPDGYGEVLITTAGGNSNHIAGSQLDVTIPEGTKVIVSEVKDQILYVDVWKNE